MNNNAPLALLRPQFGNAPQLSDPAAEWERSELLELGENILEHAPSARPRFQSWMHAVSRLSDNVCRSFSPEAALASLTGELRRLWLGIASERAGKEAPAATIEAPVLRPA